MFYYGLLLGICALWALLCVGGRSKVKDRLFLIIVFVAFTIISAIRYDVGIDYSYVYGPQYEQVINNPDYPLAGTRFEPGFVLMEKVISSFTANYQMLFVVTSVITMGLFFVYYWFNAGNPFVAVFLFMSLSQFYCTMNFMRQSIAAGILFAAFPLLKQRKWQYYLLYVGLIGVAATFHKSALVMILFIFINLLPVNNPWVLVGFGAVTVACYFGVPIIMEIVTQFWYSEHLREAPSYFEPQFTISAICLFLLLLSGSRWLIKIDKSNYLYINFAFFAFFFTLMGTRHHILDRLSMQFMFAVPVGISILIDNLGRHKDGATIFSKKSDASAMRRVQYCLTAVVAFVGSLTIHDYALYMDHHGVNPYQIIYDQSFYQDYKDMLKYEGDEPETMESVSVAELQ